MLTKRNYEAFAAIVAEIKMPKKVRKELVKNLDVYFKSENPNYNLGIFKEQVEALVEIHEG